MLTAFINALLIRRLGLSRLVFTLFFVALLGLSVAGVIYTAVVIHALAERNRAPHVHHPVR